ncbi:MAG: PA0069 family radical SAM protein [Ignavibacteria bacterium]|jgi:DNA repair photolyase
MGIEKTMRRKSAKGRGTIDNPQNRFEKIEYIPESEEPEEEIFKPQTEYFVDTSKTVISCNDSPDLYGAASINPYRGCEHGCIYCYARPTHEYLSLSPGLDFETKIFVKKEMSKLLRKELASKKWEPKPVMLCGNTDAYQPIEKELRISRKCLEVLRDFRNPVFIVTKNHLVTRDIDILSGLAEFNAASVSLSVTTLDNRLSSIMEPRTSKPHMRLDAIEKLAKAGIPTGVMVAPVIPGLTDQEMPEILKQAANAGATRAGYVLLRLPFALKNLFENWLEKNFPDRKKKVMNRLRDLYNGKLYDSSFFVRGRGTGVMAEQINKLFKVSCLKTGIKKGGIDLLTTHFRNPEIKQLSLF